MKKYEIYIKGKKIQLINFESGSMVESKIKLRDTKKEIFTLIKEMKDISK